MKIFLLFLLLVSPLRPQIVWTDVSSQFSLPAGVKIFKGEKSSPTVHLQYIEVDNSRKEFAVRPYYSSAFLSAVPFAQKIGAIAMVNGGYFGPGVSYSAVVYPDSLVAKNIGGVTRTAGAYTMTRSFFSLDITRKPAIDWIYHFGNTPRDIYRYTAPTPNTPSTPAPAPNIADGKKYDSILVGIGGAPRLVKQSQVHITYDEEVMFGSGVGRDNPDPRTAVGFTADNRIILLTVDGRGVSAGLSLPELAEVMIDLGCVQAMNLDGGGSTQMAAKTSGGYALVNTPSETRSIPSVLAVVPIDSSGFPLLPAYQRIIDTGDPEVTMTGTGWIENNTAGYWGTTKAKVAQNGTGQNRAVIRPANLPANVPLELQAWWVNFSLNSKDTPFIIRHHNGTDTVRMDQSKNAGKWVTVGTYTFSGDTTDAVTITDAATTNFVVCADAVRFVSYDPVTNVRGDGKYPVPGQWRVEQNFPNPFNPETTIRFLIPSAGHVTLAVYDLLGRKIDTIIDHTLSAGGHSVRWNGARFASGIYFYRLTAGAFVSSHKMVLLR